MLQIVFEATRQPTSTEKFQVPYTLEGEIRTYNQSMLDRFEIRALLVFFCVEKEAVQWRFFDWRTLRTGIIDSELLVSLLEPLF